MAASGLAPQDVVIDLARVALPLTARELFGDDRLLEVELGVGKGRFLLEWAFTHPESGFIGVERARPYLELAELRVRRRGLTNVRLLRTTAEDLLFRCLATGSVSAIHIYFPDPWPKKRHHKRRFFKAANLARAAEVLLPGGELLVKTDHADYAAAIAELLTAERLLQELDADATFAALPPSGYEAKYEGEGRVIHRFARARIP